MGLTSGTGGEDRLQVGLAVFCIVVSLMVTALTPVIVPEYDAADGDGLANARSKMENFTGESMISMSPWKLTWTATPYTANNQTNVKTTWGWVYGSVNHGYSLNGTTYLTAHYDSEEEKWVYDKVSEIIKMDPTKKSWKPLSTGTAEIKDKVLKNEWADLDTNLWTQLKHAVLYGNPIAQALGQDEGEMYEDGIKRTNAFEFTGLLYHFSPYYRISTQDSSSTKLNSDNASLNVVWYDGRLGTGISGGLVLASDKTKAIIANYNADDIIRDAQTDSEFATKYLLNFNNINVYMYIQFDNEVITTGMDLRSAWDAGMWTIAFASPSADGLMDIFNANDLSSSVGNLIDTYVSIFTFDMPNCPAEWSVALWVMCVLPMEIALIMFLSRFGVSGIAAGVLGSALAFIGAGL